VEKLAWYGVECKLINALIYNRSQYVQINDKVSDVRYTTKGIQQGAATSSFYFSIYINDMPESIKSSKTILFADDTSLANSCHVDDLTKMIKNIESVIEHE